LFQLLNCFERCLDILMVRDDILVNGISLGTNFSSILWVNNFTIESF
jgi:hypothetical protein